MSHIHDERSLGEVHASVDPSKAKSGWRRVFAFFGPAYLISVGYMDPGNWATDIAGGSGFGYALIWVLLMSNLMALLLQSLSARLGIVQGRDLAQCNRYYYPRGINIILYALAEIAIAACDLAEVLGMAIGLNLLLHIPLLYGVLISLLDTFLLLYLQRLGIRKLEAFIITLIGIIGLCFWAELLFAKPPMGEVAKGFIPTIPNRSALYIAIGIIGATVMPHNLYLHSALVQTRRTGTDKASIKKAIRFNVLDSTIALNLAFFVNAAILVLAASVFYSSGLHQVATMEQAHKLLAPMLGSQWAAHLFAIALIAAGQSSTVTGTLAGQIVMEGYLQIRINPWLRRLITRLLAIIPAVIVILIMGDQEVNAMLIFSQVILSMQLAFAIIPLIHFVSDRSRMGDFAINTKVKILAWLVAIVIIGLDLSQLIASGIDWMKHTNSGWVQLLTLLFVAGFIALLGFTIFYPLILRKRALHHPVIHPDNVATIMQASVNPFKHIALAVDYTDNDRAIIAYALKLAEPDTHFTLIHIVESAASHAIGEETQDLETLEDKQRMAQYEALFRDRGFTASGQIGFRQRIRSIAHIVNQEQADLLVVGSHGHRSIKDFIFGETVNALRHKVRIPVFIAQQHTRP